MQCSSGATLNPTASAAVNPRSGPLAIENKTFWGLKSFFSFLACWPASGDRKYNFLGPEKFFFPSLPADRPLAIENKTFWGLKSFFSFLACWPASGPQKSFSSQAQACNRTNARLPRRGRLILMSKLRADLANSCNLPRCLGCPRYNLCRFIHNNSYICHAWHLQGPTTSNDHNLWAAPNSSHILL